jgi:hypothetical protein
LEIFGAGTFYVGIFYVGTLSGVAGIWRVAEVAPFESSRGESYVEEVPLLPQKKEQKRYPTLSRVRPLKKTRNQNPGTRNGQLPKERQTPATRDSRMERERMTSVTETKTNLWVISAMTQEEGGRRSVAKRKE